MSRRTTVACFFLSLACAVSPACSAPGSTDPTPLPRPAHPGQPPQQLPGDVRTDAAPTPPPPNVDGSLSGDAEPQLRGAVPFEQGARKGRIGTDDHGDGWIIQGVNGDVVGMQLRNLSPHVEIRLRFIDAQDRPVVMPSPWIIPAGESLHQSLELSRTDAEQTLVAIVEAEQPVDYEITFQIE